jgi:serine phosphatase RsbU (regulator of sigma subunit)
VIKRILYLLVGLVFLKTGFSQNPEKKKQFLDKLYSATNDSTRIYYMNMLSGVLQRSEFNTALDYATKALDLSEKTNNIRGKVSSYNNIGDAYWYHSDYITAQRFYFKAYKINDSIKDKKGIAESLYNIGWIIVMQQKNVKEVGYLYRSLALYEELKDAQSTAGMLNTLSQFYSEQYSSTGKKENYDSAMVYLNKVIELCKNNKEFDKDSYISFYGSLADLMSQSGDYVSAKFYMEKRLDRDLNFGDSLAYFNDLDIMAGIEFHLGHIEKAIELAKECHDFAERKGFYELLMGSCAHLNEFYFSKKDLTKAYSYYNTFITLRDSMNKQLFSANLNDIQNGYELDKKEASIKQLTQANEIQELKAKQNGFILLGVGVVLLIIIIIAYLLYKQNRQKNAANLLLKEQNTIITEKKQEIEHSIQYAKGIQNALLPAIKEIKNVFPEGFIYYLPKDVVSGDFYWFHKLGEHFYLVAADCTGHGVPGALMSIVGMDKITQAIFEKKITEPKAILEFLNVEIKNTLKQHDDETKQRDGMDLALVRINVKTNTLDFAAANRPLYIVSEGKLREYKSDKVAIAGFTPDDHAFKQLTLQLNKGDRLYLTTDGFADQFGGSESKKFMTRNFKALLESLPAEDMNAQEKELINSHLTWKGHYEQVDDILVIGIKV